MIPVPKQRVRVTGLDGVFLVVGVDHDSKLASVMLVDGPAETVTVPFAFLQPEHPHESSHKPN